LKTDPMTIGILPSHQHKREVLRMSPQEIPPPLALFGMVTGYYVSRAIYVIAKLGIADHLSEGPRRIDDLAAATGTHAPSLMRVLRLLTSIGVFTEDADSRFALTPIGACLRAGVPGSMRATALLLGGITQQAWGDLQHSVETGEPAFRRVFGMDSFDYMAQHSDEAANFDAAMAELTEHLATAVVAAYDFSPFRRVVDVGGGTGALLAGVLKANSRLAGVLFELPHVAERAIMQVRKLGLASRCEIVGGDFFKSVPGGGDAYLLKHVIHNWNDDRAVEILKNCRRAMRAKAKLLVLESVYPLRIDQSDESRVAAANDVNFLVCTGGRERSQAEFGRLYEAAGFRLTRILPTQTPVKVIEGIPS
jgi:SAM-dependent methyltransferase